VQTESICRQFSHDPFHVVGVLTPADCAHTYKRLGFEIDAGTLVHVDASLVVAR
jgi:hypothetical protein